MEKQSRVKKTIIWTMVDLLKENRGFFNANVYENLSMDKIPAETPERHRIGKFQGGAMVVLALMFDGLQAIMTLFFIGFFVNWIFALVAWIIFYIWFRLNGVGFLDKGAKKIVTVLISEVVESLPLLNTIPAITIGVVIILFFVNSEDAVYNKTRGNVGT